MVSLNPVWMIDDRHLQRAMDPESVCSAQERSALQSKKRSEMNFGCYGRKKRLPALKPGENIRNNVFSTMASHEHSRLHKTHVVYAEIKAGLQTAISRDTGVS